MTNPHPGLICVLIKKNQGWLNKRWRRTFCRTLLKHLSHLEMNFQVLKWKTGEDVITFGTLPTKQLPLSLLNQLTFIPINVSTS